MSVSHFDNDLISRHNVSGPRYTSYPTADRFREGEWKSAYVASLQNEDLRALSLYLHIPFCSTICFYCACNKINTANLKRSDSYVRRLIHEMALHSQLIDGPHEVQQLHFGGGTPTFLSDDQFIQLFEAMRTYFSLADNETRDFSIEIDPRNVSKERIDNLAMLGINRLSVGVQDFDPKVQLAVNRIQSIEETRTVIEAARSNDFRSINIDLINGLPRQSMKGFSRTLRQVIELQPDRISLYSYAHLPHVFKTQRQIDPNELPSAKLKLKFLEMAVNMLTEADYEYVGMDHFAKKSDSLIQARHEGTLHRNFQGYTTHAHCQLIGLGVSSIGNVGRVYVQNAKTLSDYYESIDANQLAIVRGIEADNDDVIINQTIQDLMCRFEIDLAAFETANGIRFRDYFAAQVPELELLEKQSLLHFDSEWLRVTENGRFLIRNICMVFDAYLTQGASKFSKAI